MSLAWTLRIRSNAIDLLCPDDATLDEEMALAAAVVTLLTAPLATARDREALSAAGRVEGVRFIGGTVDDLPAIVETLRGAGCTLRSS